MSAGNSVSNALAGANDFHPLSGIIDQPLIDPILQGDMTVKGDVVPGSYVDKKDQNLGVNDMQQTAGFFSKAIAGGLGGAALGGGSGTAATGTDLEAVGTGAEATTGGGDLNVPGGGMEEQDMLAGKNMQQLGVQTPVGSGPEGNVFNPPTAPTGTDPNTGMPAFLDATTPVASLDPSTAAALGITDSGTAGGLDASFNNAVGVSPGGVDTGIFNPGQDSSIYTGAQPTDMTDPVPDQTIKPEDVTGGKTPGVMDNVNAALKKVGLNPATAGLLGISGIQALTKPKTPQASRTLEGTSTTGSQQAQAVIQSGGQSSPAWDSQKQSIDATIDQQIQQQSQAILQQAQNSGQGADSQVTVQQINKLKTQLEAQRQTLYAQAQGQNVQAALSQLGISDQALSGVAAAQYKASQDARSSAANTAQMALMLQALSRGSGSQTPTQ